MKKFIFVLIVVFSFILMSCPSPIVEAPPDEPFTFQVHWNVYNYEFNYYGNDVYFEKDQYWILYKDKMTAGARFNYTDTEFTSYLGDAWYGTQKYDIIDKDTVFINPPNGNGMSWFSYNTFKRSGRTGKMRPVNGSWTFVDD